MILRKPYGFLIKYFKVLHLISAALIAYLIFSTNKLLVFFNEYINSSTFVVGQELTDVLFNFWMFIIPFVICLFLITIMVVMVVKKKPYLFYIINIIVYIFVLIVYNVVFNVVAEMETVLVDIRTIRAIRDVLMILWAVQAISIIVTSIRATGFDIKKFNFGEDLQELDIAEEDREEFEVDFGFDTDLIKRNFRRRLRYLRYFYVERKFLINIISLVLIAIVSFTAYMNLSIYNKVIEEGVYFNTTGALMRIDNSYVTTKDYRGRKIVDNTTLIILEVNARGRGTNSIELSKSRLQVGESLFYHSAKYRDRLTDLGIVYEGQELSLQDTNTYLLVYEIPNELKDNEIIFVYNDSNQFVINAEPRNIKVKLNLKDIDRIIKVEEYEVGEEVNFVESIFKNTKFKIDEVIIADRFSVNYEYCLSQGDCYPSSEYIRPDIFSNFDKSLMKIVGNLNWDDNLTSPERRTDLTTFINRFGRVEYEVDGKMKIQPISMRRVTPVKSRERNTYYFEILSELKNSDKIEIVLSIRDIEYRYRVK